MDSIISGIRAADTEHVVYFLLAAYVEARVRRDTLRELPARLPVRTLAQVDECLRWLEPKALAKQGSDTASPEEASAVFAAARERLEALQSERASALPRQLRNTAQQDLAEPPFVRPPPASLPLRQRAYALHVGRARDAKRDA